MFRRYLGRSFQFELLHPDGDGTGGGGDADAIKKANFERDAAAARAQKLADELEALKKKLPTDEQLKKFQDLEAAQAQADEDRKKKAGEFETLKQDLVAKHNETTKALNDRIAALEGEISEGEIGRAFSSAMIDKASIFGGSEALTVLPAELASKALREYVSVELKDGKRVITVKDATGKVIVDPTTGNPQAFAPAVMALINSLPTKDHILRGSGKTGSGSSGGAQNNGGNNAGDGKFTDQQLRDDPNARAAKKREQESAGGMQIGSAFDRMQMPKK